jgi:hypothetical protein
MCLNIAHVAGGAGPDAAGAAAVWGLPPHATSTIVANVIATAASAITRNRRTRPIYAYPAGA